MNDINTIVTSELVFPNIGTPCEHGKDNWYPLGCIHHDYKHIVGYGCYNCHKQWFLETDWRTETCRKNE